MLKKHKLFLLTLLIISAFISSLYIYKQFIEEKPKVVVVLKDFNLQYWKLIKAGAEKGFKDFDIDGKVVAPKNATVEEQRDILKNVLKENPDVLIVSPMNSSDIILELEKFVKKDIPVLLISSDDPWEKKTAYIGTNNMDLGRKAGMLMASQLHPGDKVALLGRGQSLYEVERLRGARGSLESVGIKIAVEKGDLPLGNENFKVAGKVMETILRDHPDLKGVVATTDYLAIPALKVIQEHGLEIPVTGADGISEMLQLINEGALSTAIAQNPYDMGYLGVETALKVTKGEKVEKTINSGVDIITKGNAKQRLDFYNHVLE